MNPMNLNHLLCLEFPILLCHLFPLSPLLNLAIHLYHSNLLLLFLLYLLCLLSHLSILLHPLILNLLLNLVLPNLPLVPLILKHLKLLNLLLLLSGLNLPLDLIVPINLINLRSHLYLAHLTNLYHPSTLTNLIILRYLNFH
jgi:hypothetical protein